jgi:hypothetical protein
MIASFEFQDREFFANSIWLRCTSSQPMLIKRERRSHFCFYSVLGQRKAAPVKQEKLLLSTIPQMKCNGLRSKLRFLGRSQ